MHRLLCLAVLAGCTPTSGGSDNDPNDALVANGGAADGAATGDPDVAGGADPDDGGPIAADGAEATPDAADPDAAPPDVPTGLEVGQRAPDFTLPDHESADVSLSSFQGQSVLVFGSSLW